MGKGGRPYLNISKAKQELDRVRNALAEYENLIDEQETLRAKIIYKGVNLKERTSGGARLDMSDGVTELVNLTAHIERSLDRWAKNYATAQETINGIDDSIYRQVLRSYYLDGKNLSAIAYQLQYTKGHIKKLKREALKAYASVMLKR